MESKKLIVLFVVAALWCAAVIAVVFTATSSKLAAPGATVALEKPEYGFGIAYPNSWIMAEELEDGDYTLKLVLPDEPIRVVVVSVSPDTSKAALDVKMGRIAESQEMAAMISIHNYSKTVFGGIDAYKITGEFADGSGPLEYMVMIRGGNDYHILVTPSFDDPKAKEVTDTFEFL